MRLVVNEVYWVGGFGDRNYIVWIPVSEWKGVSEEEWKEVRLPGEEGYGKAMGCGGKGKGWMERFKSWAGRWEL